MKHALLTICLFIITSLIHAQITVSNSQTPVQLVQNVLLGKGVNAFNISYNTSQANANAIQQNVSYFDATGTNFPIHSGLLLTTGKGIGAVGPNDTPNQTNDGTPSVSLDPHLNELSSNSVENGAVLEFDFIPTGDSISFRYIFASEEYPEYSPSLFNDVFGFFLWGPGISGPYMLSGYPDGGTNLALIPGTSMPVSINNVGDQNNTQYYVPNDNGSTYGTAIQYDGTTVLFSSSANVQCGQTYHIKLAICNVFDEKNDSGVFLEANSFNSDAIQLEIATLSGDSAIYEGCSNAQIIFTRPASQTDSLLTVTIDLKGNAIKGVDYTTLLTDQITFDVGEDTVIVTVEPSTDGVTENPESLKITAYTLNDCGDSLTLTEHLWIADKPKLDLLGQDTILPCRQDSILVKVLVLPVGGVGIQSITWSNGETGTSSYVSGKIKGSSDYVITLTDQCNNSVKDTLTVTVKQTLEIDTLIAGSSTCEPTGWVSAKVSGAIGVPLNTWNGPGSDNPNAIDATVWQELSSGWYFFTVEDNFCTEYDSVFVDILKPPKAKLTVTPDTGCGTLEVSMTNTSENADKYQWDFGNGQKLEINSTTSQSQVYSTGTTIRLIAYQGTLCADTAYATITIGNCGCTDPNALNYDPLAIGDNGNCQYPPPTIYSPNVFTPNNDGSNDLFFLTVTDTKNVELVIINRWGSTMFKMKGVNPSWNGKTETGFPVDEGVYFYRYVLTGLNDEVLEGHGFVQLVR